MLRKVLISTGLSIALVWSAATPADAQGLRSDRATYFTFSQPVSLPTVTLPAGKYLFRLMDSPATRSVVQVYSADGAQLHAMLLTLPASRNEASDEPEIRFLETAENVPPAIATWWYPGMKTGWEFIYPREQALRLARSSKQPVLTTAQDATGEGMKTADLVRVTPSGQTPASTGPIATPPTGAAQRGEIAATPPTTTTTPPPAPSARSAQDQVMPSAPARSELPQTASMTPLIALIGALTIFAGLGLAVWRRRTA